MNHFLAHFPTSLLHSIHAMICAIHTALGTRRLPFTPKHASLLHFEYRLSRAVKKPIPPALLI